MFPIRDQRGRVLGFGARAQRPDEKAKYVNSPEGELYRKGHTLYGIDLARTAIAKAKRAIVVEGYTDVIALHQAGVTETVGDHGDGDHARAAAGAGSARRTRWCWRWTPTARAPTR